MLTHPFPPFSWGLCTSPDPLLLPHTPSPCPMVAPTVPRPPWGWRYFLGGRGEVWGHTGWSCQEEETSCYGLSRGSPPSSSSSPRVSKTLEPLLAAPKSWHPFASSPPLLALGHTEDCRAGGPQNPACPPRVLLAVCLPQFLPPRGISAADLVAEIGHLAAAVGSPFLTTASPTPLAVWPCTGEGFGGGFGGLQGAGEVLGTVPMAGMSQGCFCFLVCSG